MTTNFQEKREAKKERYEELAQKFENQSAETHERANKMADAIPFGQPILAGHHSEGADRKFRNRIHNTIGKAIELSDKADYYKHRAENISNNISSDDDNAINLLKEKLEKLEAEREMMKKANQDYRRGTLKVNDVPFLRYQLSNLAQNIKSIKTRIDLLNKISQVEDSEKTENGITLKIDKGENRVMFMFDAIPDEEIRKNLKRNGFKWSPTRSAWVRMITPHAIYISNEIFKKLTQETKMEA